MEGDDNADISMQLRQCYPNAFSALPEGISELASLRAEPP
jgi:hypothetical protein